MNKAAETEALYRALIDAWNCRDAEGFAGLFAPDGNIVGFDGSQVDGADAIRQHLAEIFRNHRTAAFVTIVREVRILAPTVTLLRAVAGMAPDGKDSIDPALNAVQTLVATEIDGQSRVALFQNTPAALHGRPEAVEQLSEELRRVQRKMEPA